MSVADPDKRWLRPLTLIYLPNDELSYDTAGVGVYRSSDANGKRATGSTLDRPINLSMPDGSGHSISGRESLEQPNTPPSVASSAPR